MFDLVKPSEKFITIDIYRGIGEITMEKEVFDDEITADEPQTPPPGDQNQAPPPEREEISRYGRPKRAFLEKLTTNSNLSKILLAGFLIMLIGMLMIHTAPFQTNYGSDTPDKQDDIEDDRAAQKSMKYMGDILFDIGAFMIIAFLSVASIHREDLDVKYRLGMLSFALLVLLFTWTTVL